MKSNLLIACSLLLGLAACGFGNITRDNTGDGGGSGSGSDAAIDAAPDAAYPKLTVAKTGPGSVSSTPAGIDCGSDCTEAYAPGTMVVLTATPDTTDDTFVGWTGGGCSGTGPCTVALTADTTVQAQFVMNNTVVVTLAGNGTGGVTSNPAGINCGTTCMHTYAPGTMVTLTAAATGDSTFTGWSGGGCSGTGTCVVTVNAGIAVTATFTLNQYALTVTKAGNGTGTVTSNPAGINCGSTCTSNYDSGTMVTLTAAPTTGTTFAGWAGACSGTGTCTVTMTQARSVTATFTLDQYSLMVSKAGNGAGTVTSNPAGINCGATCSAAYNYNTMVTLTAAASTGSTFTGWSGACSGTGTCTVTMSAAQSVTATFTLNMYALTVTLAGNGSGSVATSDSTINCGSTCSANYNYNTMVSLTATASTGSTFSGWSGGGCSGTGTCTVTMTAAQSVTATFTLNTYALTVSKAGTGGGTVTSNPAGINCGATCSANYNYNTMVTLTASAASGSTFAGWAGACMGTGTCTVTMTVARNVTATFNQTVSCAMPTTVDVYATDRIDFNYSGVSTQVWRGDSYFRAYNDNFSPLDITGWLEFNMTAIPAGAQITAMSLYAYAETVQMAPMVRLQYSAATNNWANATVQITDTPRTNLQISPAAYVPTVSAYNVFPVDLSTQSFAADLVDHWLTIGVDTTSPAYAYAYFTSPTAATNKPFLRITYCNCTSSTVTLTATQSVSIDYTGTSTAGVYRDNSNRAYSNPNGNCGNGMPCDINGWMEFDTTSIPDTATITAMTLNAYANTVQMGPSVHLNYSAGNNWTRATVIPTDLPRTNVEVAPPITPTVSAYNAWSINVSSQNFAQDLTDNSLTLGLDNVNLAYSYGYFDGADATGNRPNLVVTYCQ